MSRLLDLVQRAVQRLIMATGLTKNETLRTWVFRVYYDRNSWGHADSRSGVGSTLAQTEVIRRELPALFQRCSIRTLLDVPCGDGHWWRHLDNRLDGYSGADVVPKIIARRKVDGRPGESFYCLDVATDPLPLADAILCRDLLVHFSYDLAFDALRNMKASSAKYLIATTFPGRKNQDIKTGLWRPIDLTAPPFNFPTPLELINEGCTEANGRFADKSLGVWLLTEVPGGASLR